MRGGLGFVKKCQVHRLGKMVSQSLQAFLDKIEMQRGSTVEDDKIEVDIALEEY